MKRRMILASLALATGMSGVVAAGAFADTSKSAQSSTPDITSGCMRDDRVGGYGEIPVAGINTLVNQSDAAVVATVTDVSPPRWNSADGAEWCKQENEPGSRHAVAFQCREATLSVKDVVFATSKIDTSVRQIKVVLPGDGQLTDAPGDHGVVGGVGFEMSTNEWAENVLHKGETAFLLLQRADADTKEGSSSIVSVSYGHLGKWHIDDSTPTRAKSQIAGRDVDVKQLTQRIKDERLQGRRDDVAADRRTSINPLA